MHECNQTVGMTIFQHGEMVAKYFEDIYFHISKGTPLELDWNLPVNLIDWYKVRISSLEEFGILHTYAVYHDCGKPYCLTIDEQGKRHFPNHAQVSYDTWIQATGDEQIGWYILHDMDMHVLRGDCLDQLLKDSRSLDLLLMAYSEIHANASMFGGIESTSFKIKKKKLDKAFKKACEIHLDINKNVD